MKALSLTCLLALASTASGTDGPATPQIWVTAGPYVRWVNPPENPPAWWAKRSDEWQMFTVSGEGRWETVAHHVAALMTAIHSIQAACLENRTSYAPRSCADLGLSNEQSLDQYFRYINAHHLAFVFEIGLLIDTQVTGAAITAGCGKEAFGREAAVRAVFQKIKDAGGSIDYIRMDEPFFYGTVSCHDSAANVAADLSRSINNIVRAYFPKARIGDVEPTYGEPDEGRKIEEWAEDFRQAVGLPLAFFHADANWNSGPTIGNFAAIERVLDRRSIPFGIIYNAAEGGNNDMAWARSAIEHFVTIEAALGLHIDQPVFQSWTASPAQMLPEETPGTLLNVAFQYVLPAPALSLRKSVPGKVQVSLVDERHSPIVGAHLEAEAVDVGNRWGSRTNRVITGRTPPNAAYGVVGIRANSEGVWVAADGEADLGQILLRYIDAAGEARTWKSTYPVPYRIALSPRSKLVTNLPASGTACGNPALSVAADSAYSLTVPISATQSADHAGYATLIFLDRQCRGITRAFVYFTPASRILPLPQTDSTGHVQLDLAPQLVASRSQLRVSYGGDNATHRPSMATLNLE